MKIPLEEKMATHSSTLAWKTPWTEEPGGLQSWGRKESDTTERLHFHFLSVKKGKADCCDFPLCSGLSWRHRRSLGPEQSSRTLTIVPGLAPAGDGAQGARGEAGVGAGQADGGHGCGEAGGRRQLQQGHVVAHGAQVPLRVFEDLCGTGGWAGRRAGGKGVGRWGCKGC